MSITSPWRLVLGVLVVAVLIAAAVVTSRRRRAALAQAGAVARNGRSPFGLWLSIAGIAILAVAVAGPAASVPVTRAAGTVIIAMDVSNSMSATDVAPSRLAAAKKAAVAFVDAQPSSVDVGVVAFQTGALTTNQPTADHTQAAAAIQRLELSGGTSLAAAILTSLSAITGKPVAIGKGGTVPDLGYWGSATIILFSDGGDEGSGTATAAAATAAQTAGVHVETVGVGTTGGSTVEVDGYRIQTALDEGTLATIAKTTGGSYHPAATASELDGIASTINLRLTTHHEQLPLAGAFTAFGIALLAVGAIFHRPTHGKARLMTFDWPWALLSLAAIPLVFGIAWWSRRRRRRAAVRVTSVLLVRNALPGRTLWRRRIPVALLVLGLVVLGFGAARPQRNVDVSSNATTIMLALDVSGSMCSTDVSPNRIDAAEKAATEFVKAQRGARIGLVAFAGSAQELVPPTTDTDKLLDAMKNLQTSRGTAIGQAILTSIDSIAEIDPSVAPTGAKVTANTNSGYAAATIVVLTDGANTEGVDPKTAAQQAADRRLRVYTIGFGTTTPSPLVCDRSQIAGGFGGGGFGFRGGGGRNPLIIDEQALRTVADTTGGRYYRAVDAGELQSALKQLPSTITVAHKRIDVADAFAGIGGLLVAAAIGLSLWWNRVRRLPGRPGPTTTVPSNLAREPSVVMPLARP